MVREDLFEKDTGEKAILRERLGAEGKKWVGRADSVLNSTQYSVMIFLTRNVLKYARK